MIKISQFSILLIVITAILMIFCLHIFHYYPFIEDDALISLQYAKRLLQGNGLTWTDGKPVEGYSNLLWILLTAGLGRLGIDLITSVRILGLIAMFIAFGALVFYFKPWIRSGDLVAITIGLFFLSFSGTLAVWTIGGLEQPLIVALLSLSIFFIWKFFDQLGKKPLYLVLTSLCLGLLSVSRLDGPIFAVSIGIVLLAWYGINRANMVRLLNLFAFPALFYGGQLLFRILYYGEIFPNTAFAKISPSTRHFKEGFQYISEGFLALAPFSFLAVAFLIWLWWFGNEKIKAILLFSLISVWSVYLVFIGGDIFPAWRHLAPVIIVMAFALVLGFKTVLVILTKQKTKPVVKVLLTLIIIGAFATYIPRQFSNPRITVARKEIWEWNGKRLAILLKQAFGDYSPLLAVTAAGCFPYWSDLPVLDIYGLNDYYLARHRPDEFGKGILGHELGNAEYILSRNPDIVCFNYGALEPTWVLQGNPRFLHDFTPVVLAEPPPRQFFGVVWINKFSSKIGIRKTANVLKIPAFLFNETFPKCFSYLNVRDELVSSLSKDRPLSVTLQLTPSDSGHFSFQIIPQNDRINYEARQIGKGLLQIKLSTSETSYVELKEILLTISD